MPGLDHRCQEGDKHGTEMGGAAGVFLRSTMKRDRIGEAQAINRGASAVAKQRDFASDLAIERHSRSTGDRWVGRFVTIEAHAIGIQQTGLGFLNHHRGKDR